MKSIKTFVAVIAGYLFWFFRCADSDRIRLYPDGAEAKIAAQAQEAGASSYKITQHSPVTAYT